MSQSHSLLFKSSAQASEPLACLTVAFSLWLCVQVLSPLFVAAICALQRLDYTIQSVTFNALIEEGIILKIDAPIVKATIHKTWTSLTIIIGFVVIAAVIGPFSSNGVTVSVLLKIALDWRKYFTFVSEDYLPLASRAAKIADINERARAGFSGRAIADGGHNTAHSSFRVQNPLDVIAHPAASPHSPRSPRSPSSPREALTGTDASNVLQSVNVYGKACVTLTEKELFWVRLLLD